VPPAEIQDAPARRASPEFPWWNRDGCRSPMPWTADRGGGFTTGHPWIRLIPDADERNVERQLAEPNSVLAAYRRLLVVRRQSSALTRGSLALEPAAPDVLAFVREADGERVLVAVNFALDRRTLTLPAGSWLPLFDTDAVAVAPGPESGQLELAGLQAVLMRAIA
jgi:alpha-glucosidase